MLFGGLKWGRLNPLGKMTPKEHSHDRKHKEKNKPDQEHYALGEVDETVCLLVV